MAFVLGSVMVLVLVFFTCGLLDRLNKYPLYRMELVGMRFSSSDALRLEKKKGVKNYVKNRIKNLVKSCSILAVPYLGN